MTIHRVLRLGDDVDRLYESGKEGGGRGGVTSFQGSVDVSIKRLEDNVKSADKDG